MTTAAGSTATPTSPLAGAGLLLRALLRHDGHRFAPWVVVATALSASSVLVYPWLFPEPAERLALAAAVGANPALGIIFGPASDLSTVDGFNAWRSLSLAGFTTALGAALAVIRATRGHEDSGQAELLASTAIGRVSRLVAAVAAALMWSLVVGAVAAVLTGLCGGGWSTSLLLGATFTASGWMFGGIAAVTAQLGSDARTASALAVGVLGVLFVLRGVTYTLGAPGWTVWANPLGWMTETRPASGDHWWPLLPALVLTLGCLAVASAIQTRRDVGHGVLATRPGPARGSVRSSWRLALRLHRGAAATWAVAFVALGAVFGFFAASVHDILGADSAVTAILAAGAATPDALVSRFVVTILGLVGIIAAVPGVQLLLRVRAEELQGRVEPVLAGAVSRRRFYAAHVPLGLVLCAAYVLLAGLLIAAVADAAGIGVSFWAVWGQAAVTVPAVWAVVAVAIAVVGARPRLAAAAWVGVVVSFALTLLGPTFRLPDPYLALSPFWHVPAVPGCDGAVGGLAGVCLVAAVLTTVGFVGFGRRDLGTV